MGSRISVVINTLNEEKNLPYALRSVRWADELVVVDMYSTDRTTEIAREFGARIYFHERLNFSEPARAFALNQATGDWTLILDADEIVPEPLCQKLRDIAQGNGEVEVVQVPRLNYLLGTPIWHSGWGPHQDKPIRFFKRGFVNAGAVIHNYMKPAPGAHILELPYQDGCALVHFNYVDCSHFLEKLNRYTTIEAQQAMERGERSNTVRALARATAAFCVRYIKWQGFREGWRGFYLCMFMAFYRFATAAKLTEMEAVGSREDVEEFYRKEADRVLADYCTKGQRL